MAIGDKNPDETERQMFRDDIIIGAMDVVRQAAIQMLGEVAKAQLGGAFGVPMAPDVVPQPGMPGANPTQTMPGSAAMGGMPVTPGGPPAVV